MSERNALEEAINSVKGFASRLEDSKELAEIAEADGDEDLWQGVLSDLQSMEKDIGHQALLAMLSGEADKNDAFLEIHAGAGGTDDLFTDDINI